MADTLLFRGGSSASIDVANVQSREIVIDTDTDQIVSGASKKKTVMEDSNGNISIDGSAQFVGPVSINGGTDELIDIRSSTGGSSYLSSTVTGKGAGYFGRGNDGAEIIAAAGNSGNRNIQFKTGSTNASSVEVARLNDTGLYVGGTLPSSPNISLNADGSATFLGELNSQKLWSRKNALTDTAFKVTTTNGVETASIKGDGTATFAGTVAYQNTSAPGGTTAIQVKDGSSTVFRVYANGETVIPKTTYFGSAGSTKMYSNGNVDVAGTLVIGQNSTLGSDGSAEFAGDVEAGDWDGANTTGSLVQAGGGFVAARDVNETSKSQAYLWQGRDGGTRTSFISQDGSARFAGLVTSSSLVVDTDSDTDGQVVASFHGNTGGINRGLDIELASINTTANALVTIDAKHSTNGALAFATRGTERLRIDQNGTFRFGGTPPSSPNITLNAGGSATFAGSVSIGGTAAANTIDEYEEGAWTATPTLDDGTTPATHVITNNAKYRRVGAVVTCYLQVTLDADVSTSAFKFSLPFTLGAGGSCNLTQTTSMDSDTLNGFISVDKMRCGFPADVTSGSKAYRGTFTYLIS